ncbi:MAG: hypothetical protein KDA33_04450 [Phycisphaerales bacterium]|nr:hypothetical protein [Phycisphaerales bacterium]
MGTRPGEVMDVNAEEGNAGVMRQDIGERGAQRVLARRCRAAVVALMAIIATGASAGAAPRRGGPVTPEAPMDATGQRLIERENISVRYKNLPREYAEAIATIASSTYHFYKTYYNLDMPDRLFIETSVADDNCLGVWISDDHTIQLRYTNEREFAPPHRSRVDTIYGLTYRIADLGRERTLGAALWLSDDGARGLSHLLACRIIDRLHNLYGARLWPQPYDYVETGWRELRERIKRRNESEIIKASGQWHAFESEFDAKSIGDTLGLWRRATISPTRPAEELLGVLTARVTESHKRSKLRRWFRGFEPICVWTRSRRAKFEKSFNSGRLARDAQSLKYDDDQSDGATAISAGGHIVTYQTPQDQWYVREVEFHAERYGNVPRSGKDFTITILDEKFKAIGAWTQPYGMLRGSGGRWYRANIPVTRLPPKFVVLIDFGSTKDVGVKLSADTSSTGHSAIGDLRHGIKPLDKADWMIRVEIDRLKDDNPLKYRPD